MRVIATVRCEFEIEYDDGNETNSDIEYTKECIAGSRIDELLECETEDSLQFVKVLKAKMI